VGSAGVAAAQPPALLGDVRPGMQSANVNMPLGPAFGQDGTEIAYFRMELIPNDVDIWRTDGTPEGTYPVLDFISTTQTPPGVIGVVNERLLMAQGNVLFSCDAQGGDARHLRSGIGALGGNQLLIQYRYPSGVLPGGRVFPVQLGSQFAQDLVISDGASTTVLLPNTSFPDATTLTFATPHFVPVSGGLLFPVNQSSNFPRPALWRTDGTPEGTVMVREFPRTNNNVRGVEWLTQGHGGIYFTAPALSDSVRSALWRTDGTAEGCVELINNRSRASVMTATPTP
jgi:ELWxxDGT repeat protein